MPDDAPVISRDNGVEAMRVTAWYDSDCPLCRREIALMRRLDRAGRVRFLDLAETADCPFDPKLMLARFHAREDGRIHDGAAAFAAVWRQIPLLRPLGLAARNPLVLRFLERLYLAFLKIRPWLQSIARRMDTGS